LKRQKDIRRLTDKRLKYRYGESGGTDKVAEDELRRRGLTDRQIHGVIYGYRQGEYTPRSGRHPAPSRATPERQAPPDEPTERKAAAAKVPIMHHGKFKGMPLAVVPAGYLEWCYGSFKNDRKRLEQELRSRGYDDGDLERCRRQYPVRDKSPKKQGPKD
jgi:hypothetical protein